jgi:hypothetical protein
MRDLQWFAISGRQICVFKENKEWTVEIWLFGDVDGGWILFLLKDFYFLFLFYFK